MIKLCVFANKYVIGLRASTLLCKYLYFDLSQTDLETLPEASINGALQSLYNHDPRMTLTYLMARSAEVAYPRS